MSFEAQLEAIEIERAKHWDRNNSHNLLVKSDDFYSSATTPTTDECNGGHNSNNLTNHYSNAEEEATLLLSNINGGDGVGDADSNPVSIEVQIAALKKECKRLGEVYEKEYKPLAIIDHKITLIRYKISDLETEQRKKAMDEKRAAIAAADHVHTFDQRQKRPMMRWAEWANTHEGKGAICRMLVIMFFGTLLFMVVVVGMAINLGKQYDEIQRKWRLLAVENNTWDDRNDFLQLTGNNNKNDDGNATEELATATIFSDGLIAVQKSGCGDSGQFTHVRAKKVFSVLQAVRAIEQAWVLFYHEKLFYYEVTVEKIDSKNGNVSIGLTGLEFLPLSNGSQLRVGATPPGFYAIYPNGNLALSGQNQPADWPTNSYRFGEGDVIGCGLQVTLNNKEVHQQLFFTKNSQFLGTPIHLPVLNAVDPLFPLYYPTVSMAGQVTAVRANFGDDSKRPFVYDIFNSFL